MNNLKGKSKSQLKGGKAKIFELGKGAQFLLYASIVSKHTHS